ncbi:MAG: tRNA pseudouridine(55) synthase TruB [Desulfuromonadales bacterium]|nr:tRNA pseudouridine(55) synthase TruB [Desulfuromonadales bacterium]
MNGLLLVDKPGGMTSFDVVRKVRRWCGTRQVGHCGTLDPSATGVLPVAIDSATRLVEYLMAGVKEYVAVLRLGATTDTQDGDGQILATHPWNNIERRALDVAIANFVGPILQMPPMHSALKRDGVPLYKLARQGIQVEREPREVRIDSIEILDVALPDVTLRVTCSKGTYVRTLCHDLGQILGCGAHMAALRRTRCGNFRVEQCHSVDQLEAIAAAGGTLPIVASAAALADWPGLEVHADALPRLANGVAPRLEDVAVTEDLIANEPVRLLADDELAAVGCYVPGGYNGRPGDFQLWKVFPEAFSSPEKLYSAQKL